MDLTRFDKVFAQLLKREHLPEEKTPAQIHEITTAILDRLGETQEPAMLGHGQYAVVFWLKGNRKRVLKITTDYNDAWAAQILKDKPSPWLLQVHDVFRPLPEAKVLYCIVAEKLTDAAGMELSQYLHIFDTLRDRNLPFRKMLKKGLNRKLIYALEDYYREKDRKVEEEGMDLEGWGEFGKNFKYEPLMDRYKNELHTLMEWAKALSHRRIVFYDLHAGNVRFRGRRAILVDLGYGSVPSQQSKIQVL